MTIKDAIDVLLIVLLIIACVLILFFVLASLEAYEDEIQKSKDTACRNIGYDKFIRKRFDSYCIKDGIAYNIIMDCNSQGTKCKASRIQ